MHQTLQNSSSFEEEFFLANFSVQEYNTKKLFYTEVLAL